jgi:TAT-translocated FGD2 family F420-dependent dehydrogenase
MNRKENGMAATQAQHPAQSVSENMNRRTLLKSAGITIGASAFGNSRSSGETQPDPGEGSSPTREFAQPMIGFMLGHEQFTVPELVEFGVAAEQAGFDLLATSDHLQPWQANEGHAGAAWVTMGALGQRTRKVWIGTTVTCPTFRYNPCVVAEAFASLSLLCPGRIFLGVGSGEALNEQAAVGSWPKWDERSERLIEATGLIRQLWKGQQVVSKGKFYDVNARLYDPPSKTIPLLMAGNGPKAMRRAGQYGDGLITDPKTWKESKNEFLSGARAVGKEAGRLPVLVEQWVSIGDKKDTEYAAEEWRFLPKAFKTYYDIRDPKEIQNRAEAELPLEKVYGDWVVGADPEKHIQKINELFQSGVTIVNIHSGEADQRKVIDFYGRNVLPEVRKQSKAA